MINRLISDLVSNSKRNLELAKPQSIDDVRTHHQPMIGFSDEMRQQSLELKRFLRNHLYTHYRVYRMTNKARAIVKTLFAAFLDDTHLLPNEHAQKAREMEHSNGLSGKARAVADYIAGMTDRYAIREYNRLFDPDQLT